MKDILCDRHYSGDILAIFNEAIVNSTALFDYEPRTSSLMDTWFDGKERGNYPVAGVIDEHGKLLAFGSYGPFRAWPAYKYTIEHSIYVEKNFRSQGLGRRVLKRLISLAESQGYHTMIGGIEATNTASIKLHEALGFVSCSCIKEAGFKFGKWLDLAFYQLLLKGPANPVDGAAR